jgi:CRP-like cAMP-binding protein
MLEAILSSSSPVRQYMPGQVLLRRGESAEQVLHLEHGRVVLGLLDQGACTIAWVR